MTKDTTMNQPLPRDDDGQIITSASYGELWMVEITYNTDAENNWVDGTVDDSNRTLHGPFVSEAEADEWMQAYPEDTDVYDMRTMNLNAVRPMVADDHASQPVRASMLRDDWADNPDLTEDEVALLCGLSDETLQDALDQAFRRYEDMWFTVLDEVRSQATHDLLGARKELGL